MGGKDNIDQCLVVICGPGGFIINYSYNQSEENTMKPVNGVNSYLFHYFSGTAYCKIRTSKIMIMDEEKGIQYDFSKTQHILALGFLTDKTKISYETDSSRIILTVITVIFVLFIIPFVLCFFCSLCQNWIALLVCLYSITVHIS